MQKKKRLLVLEIGDSIVKAALIENSRDNIFVKDIVSFPNNKKEIEAGIKRLHGYRTHRKNTLVLIPPKKTMIRYLQLPSGDRKELKDMINFQLPRYLPYSFSDIIFDFKVVQETKEGYSKVMVASIQRQLFKEILTTIPHLEKGLQGLFISGEAEIDLLHAFQKDRKDIRAMVDISSEEVILSIFDSVGVLFMRSLNSALFIHKENWHKGIEELEKTFISFSREFAEKKIDSIIITGAKDYSSDFYNFLKERSSHSVEIFNPFEHIQYQKNIIERFNNLSFHCLIGAGMEVKKRYINLMPENFLLKKGSRFKKRNKLYLFFMLMVIIFQLSFILYKEISRKNVYLDYLRTEIRKTESKAKAIEDKEKRVSLIKSQLDMEGSCLDVLKEIYRIIPPDISINILIFERGKSLSLRGTARTMAEVFNLIPQLEKSSYFDRIISEGTKMRKAKSEVVADFQLRIFLKKR